MNFAGVRPDLISFVVDRNPAKQGKFLPGSRIPIVGERGLTREPDYVIVLPWNLRNEITEQLGYIADWGGPCDGGSAASGRHVKVAVTGGTGFVGRHVLAELEQRGIVGHGCCSIATPCVRAIASVGVVRDRLRRRGCVRRLGRPDMVIHLAWGGSRNYRSLHHFESELPAHYRFLRNAVAGGLATCSSPGRVWSTGCNPGALNEETEARPSTPTGSPRMRCVCNCSTFRRWSLQPDLGEALLHLRAWPSTDALFPQLEAAVCGETRFDMSAANNSATTCPSTRPPRSRFAGAGRGEHTDRERLFR